MYVGVTATMVSVPHSRVRTVGVVRNGLRGKRFVFGDGPVETPPEQVRPA